MEVEPSTWYSSRVTLPSHDLAHWRLTSQPCLCSNHHSTWAHNGSRLKWNISGHKLHFCTCQSIYLRLCAQPSSLEYNIKRPVDRTSNISSGECSCVSRVAGCEWRSREFALWPWPVGTWRTRLAVAGPWAALFQVYLIEVCDITEFVSFQNNFIYIIRPFI